MCALLLFILSGVFSSPFFAPIPLLLALIVNRYRAVHSRWGLKQKFVVLDWRVCMYGCIRLFVVLFVWGLSDVLLVIPLPPPLLTPPTPR